MDHIHCLKYLEEEDKIAACCSLYKSGLSIAAIQRQLGIKSKSTVYRLLRLDGTEPSRR